MPEAVEVSTNPAIRNTNFVRHGAGVRDDTWRPLVVGNGALVSCRHVRKGYLFHTATGSCHEGSLTTLPSNGPEPANSTVRSTSNGLDE